jgi:hypothetical protein
MRSDRKDGEQRSESGWTASTREIGTPKGRANLARQALRRLAGRSDQLAARARRRYLLKAAESTTHCAAPGVTPNM